VIPFAIIYSIITNLQPIFEFFGFLKAQNEFNQAEKKEAEKKETAEKKEEEGL
jgi:hypothetical protein